MIKVERLTELIAECRTVRVGPEILAGLHGDKIFLSGELLYGTN